MSRRGSRRQAADRRARASNPQIDAGLESIVLRCLTSEPGGRPASAGELASELCRYLGWWPSAARGLQRRRREVVLGALAAGALAIAGGVYVSQLPPAEERYFARGIQEYDRGEFDAAATTFADCLSLRPDWPAARFARGQALRQAGDPGAARTEFLALKNYDVALAYSMAGYCDLVLENTVAADNDYAVAIQAGASDPITWTNLGYCQKRQRQYRQAIASLDKALAADPDLSLARCHRALARFHESLAAGQPGGDLMLADIRKACRLEPQRADFHFHAAVILAQHKNADEALKAEAVGHLRRALELGHPRQSLKGAGQGLTALFDRLPPDLLEPHPQAAPPAPAPLFLSPTDLAALP